MFPDFDGNLRDAFKTESELVRRKHHQEDRSILDLLDADYTFLNERWRAITAFRTCMARSFRRVTLNDENRKGLLGQGSILMVTSFRDPHRADHSRQMAAGKHPGYAATPAAAERLLAAGEERDDGRVLTMRQQMEIHRANAACASCHKVMDPLGFALENFDATASGARRTAAARSTRRALRPTVSR
jgi:hypothetical protein